MVRRHGVSPTHPFTQRFISSLLWGQGAAISLTSIFKRLLCVCTGVATVTWETCHRMRPALRAPSAPRPLQGREEDYSIPAPVSVPSLLQAPRDVPVAALRE